METQNHDQENQAPNAETTAEAPQTQETVEKKEEKKKVKDSDSDEEEQMTDAEKQLWDKIDNVLKEYHLSAFQAVTARKFIKDKVANPKDESVERLRGWLMMKVNGHKVPPKYHPRQLGCPDLVPNLPLKGWWEREELPWIAELEASFDIIKEELEQLRSQKGFQPYRSPAYASKNIPDDKIGSLGTDSGDWNVFYLYLHDIQFEDNCAKVPKTIEILNKIVPRNYHHCFFSAVTPGTHITPHSGPTGKKMRIHLPILGTEGARMRVGDETRYLEQGKCIIFDDSFNHEAWHSEDAKQTRINLIIDIWHPHLSDAEVKFFSMLLKQKLKGEKFFSEKVKNQDHLYAIIEQTRDMIKSNDSWWIT